jgi:predicted MFS family arabinose efflux permease
VSESGRAPHLARTVCALGVAQIISWGTLFYPIAVLGGAMRRELGASDIFLFGSFTAGLLLSGVASPLVGRQIDRHGGRRVLASGSLVAALASGVLAAAQGPVLLFAGWLLAGVAMAACLYDPAFATLHQLAGTSYRRAVTALTLFGGFASTVFWPLSQWLLDAFGWRQAFAVYAALHLLVCLPLHLAFVPRTGGRRTRSAADKPVPAGSHHGGATFTWLATALALAAFLGSAMAAHLIDLLTASGLSAHDAVVVGALIGPMQVAGRIMEFAFGRHLRALAVGTLAFCLMVVALALFTQVHGARIVALAFATTYGWSNGVMTIVRGTVPAELFGQHEYGALLGKLARPQFFLKAVAPVALTLLFVVDPARSLAPFALLGIAVLALLAYRLAVATGRARGALGNGRT